MSNVLLVAAGFMPAIIFFTVASVIRRFRFGLLGSLALWLGVFRAAWETHYNGGTAAGLVVVGQMVAALALFALLVLILSGKSPMGTVVSLCGAIILVPFGWSMFGVLFIGLVGSTSYAAWRWKHVTNESLGDLGIQTAMDIGILTRRKPDLSRLPSVKDRNIALAIKVAPWYLLGTVSVAGLATLLSS